jgi:hypothetical protein
MIARFELVANEVALLCYRSFVAGGDRRRNEVS